MLSALYVIARPSVRPSVTRVDQSKTVDYKIFALWYRPFSFRGRGKFHLEILTGSSRAGHQTKGGVGKRAIFSTVCYRPSLCHTGDSYKNGR